MPLPVSLSTRTVGGTFLKSDGSPETGTVKFTRTLPLESDAANTIMSGGVYTATLDGSGVMSLEVPATNDPDWAPINFTYTVELALSQNARRYNSVLVPAGTAAQAIDIVDLIPPLPTPTQPESYVRITSVGVAGGVASLDDDGLVPLDQLPGSGGGTTDWADLTGKPSTFAPSAHKTSHEFGGGDAVTLAQSQVTGLASALSGKEPTLSPGSVGQWYKYDKTWATIGKADVGLDQVDNTSDLAKPLSTAATTALGGKAATSHVHSGSDITSGTVAAARIADLSATYTTVTVFATAQLIDTLYSSSPGGTYIRRVRLSYADSTGNPDLERIYTGVSAATLAFWRNEWGAIRGTPPNSTYRDDALVRAVQNASLGGTETGGAVEVQNAARTQILWKVDWFGNVWAGTGSAAAVKMSHVLVLAAAAAVPSGTPVNTVIVRLP